MLLILSLLVIVLSSLYAGAKRKARILTNKNEELTNIVHLETWGVPSNLYSGIYNRQSGESKEDVITMVEKQGSVYVEDCMDDAALAFLNSLEVTASNIEESNEINEYEEAMELYYTNEKFNEAEEQFFEAVRGNLDTVIYENKIEMSEDILLSADDWELPVKEHEIPLKYRDLAEHSISNEVFGLQTWVCKIIGMEEFFLHITDNSAQTWLNAEIYKGYKQFNVDDIIFVEICRNKDNTVTLQSINCLERGSSSDDWKKDQLIQINHIENNEKRDYMAI
ncbi:hypothetical protein ACQKNX_23020 [Lysinibacillus sp. NPDC093712]|uniref:hypothetical protein n=1 Tax=Lysinibacillus sp. NPDC093712 TaxID=3390579 RepID=UPI003D04FBEC